MAKLGSVKYQVAQRMKELDRIGLSKHEAKAEYRRECEARGERWNPAKAPGIHSIRTMEAYRDSALNFAGWAKAYKGVKDITQLRSSHAREYLDSKRQEGKSAWTLSRDLAAINKVWDMGLSGKDCGLDRRRLSEITRSRGERSHDRKYNPENYKEQITIASAFGLRRESIKGGAYALKPCSIYEKDGRLYASVIEKGGRYRAAPCLADKQAEVQKIMQDVQPRDHMDKREFQKMYQNDPEPPLFKRYTSLIDNHAFRREYAQALYKELSEGRTVQDEYKGYDRDVLREVSEALGHSRVNVVVDHYLR